jgi:hypothetical protein
VAKEKSNDRRSITSRVLRRSFKDILYVIDVLDAAGANFEFECNDVGAQGWRRRTSGKTKQRSEGLIFASIDFRNAG